MGGYDNKGRFNPWLKQNDQFQNSYQQRDYQNLEQQQNNGNFLKDMNITWKSFSAINLLIIWVLYLTALIITKATSNEYICITFHFGALYQPVITSHYEIQRYILPIFLHSGIYHLFNNTIGLLLYGFTLENYFTTKKFVLHYILSGIGGNLLSGLRNPEVVSLGASSSLYGMFPLVILYLVQNPNMQRSMKMFYIFYICFLVFTSFINQKSKIEVENNPDTKVVDQNAHFGGLISGVFLMLASNKIDQIDQNLMKKIQLGSKLLIICGFLGLLFYNLFGLEVKDYLSKSCEWV